MAAFISASPKALFEGKPSMNRLGKLVILGTLGTSTGGSLPVVGQ